MFFFTLLLILAVNKSCLLAQAPVLSWAKSMGGTGHDYSNFITYDNAFGQLAVQLENINGNIFTLDFDQSMNGVYFISIAARNKILQRKFIVQH